MHFLFIWFANIHISQLHDINLLQSMQLQWNCRIMWLEVTVSNAVSEIISAATLVYFGVIIYHCLSEISFMP